MTRTKDSSRSHPLPAQCSDPDAVRSVWADILTPTAQAVLFASAALSGVGAGLAPQPAQAQSVISFDPGPALPTGVNNASSTMGDLDGDGDLDLLVTGHDGSSATATVYENTGQNAGSGSLGEDTFQPVGAGLAAVREGSSVAEDFDGDGDLDLLVTGNNSSDDETATIYENTGQNGGSGSLDEDTFQSVATLSGIENGSVSVGDFDGDEDLDLLVVGFNISAEPPETATIYENTGQNQGSGTLDENTFQEVGASLTGVQSAASSVGDFDGDGDLDLLVVGDPDSFGRITRIYENTGQNAGAGTLDETTFQEVADLTGVYFAASSVGDFDGDGDLDLFVAGGVDYSNPATAKIYENTGENGGSGTLDETTFQEVGAELSGVTFASTSVGDFDGDGDIDLLATGATGLYGSGTAIIYENADSTDSDSLDADTFEEAGAGLTGVSDGATSVGDLDGDLDLDLLVAGSYEDSDGSTVRTASVYENTSDIPIPVELTDLSAQRDGRAALLTWTTASEQNNAGFEVQRLVGESGRGTFESMGFVEGAGTTDQPQTYRFRTDDLRAGLHRFRLKQVDTDGSSEYSETISLRITISGAYRLTAPAPNPATDGTTIRLAVEKRQRVQIGVYDLLGRRVAEALHRTIPAQTQQSIRINTDLPSGTYFVRVRGERFSTSERLTVVE